MSPAPLSKKKKSSPTPLTGTRKKRNIKRCGVKTALLIVDMQNDFIHFKNSPVYVLSAKKVIPKIVKLLTACRKKKIPIIHTITSHKKDRSNWALRDKEYNRAYCIENTPGAKITPEINLQKKEYIIKKRRYSAFFKTGLERLLKRLKVKKLIICGVTTSCCVSSTVRDAYFRDYEVVVVSDAVSATHRDLHTAALKYFRENIGLVLKTNEVIRHL
jgi:nicotinamidase-related amidase